MKRLEVSGAVRPIYGSLGVKRLNNPRACRVCEPANKVCVLTHIKGRLRLSLSAAAWSVVFVTEKAGRISGFVLNIVCM